MLAPAGGALFGGVLAGAVVTHARIDDPFSELAVPVTLLVVAAGVAVAHLPFQP